MLRNNSYNESCSILGNPRVLCPVLSIGDDATDLEVLQNERLSEAHGRFRYNDQVSIGIRSLFYGIFI